MDESTFETFEEELGTPLQEIPPQKPVRQTRRTGAEMYSQRRMREEPPLVQQVPKAVPREPPVSRTTTLRKALSLQNVAQIEVPWEGVTLNRCLFIAISILVLTSGWQRLNEAIRGRKDGPDVDITGTALNLRHTAVRKGRLPPPQPETSLWDTLFWWVCDDDDDDDEDDEEEKRGKSKTREKASRGLRHKSIPNRNLLKRREDRFKTHRGKVREDEEEMKERVKGQKAKEKRLKQKKKREEEEEENEQEEEKVANKKTKKSKKKDNA